MAPAGAAGAAVAGRRLPVRPLPLQGRLPSGLIDLPVKTVVLVVALLYFAVYRLTTRVYLSIVQGRAEPL